MDFGFCYCYSDSCIHGVFAYLTYFRFDWRYALMIHREDNLFNDSLVDSFHLTYLHKDDRTRASRRSSPKNFDSHSASSKM